MYLMQIIAEFMHEQYDTEQTLHFTSQCHIIGLDIKGLLLCARSARLRYEPKACPVPFGNKELSYQKRIMMRLTEMVGKKRQQIAVLYVSIKDLFSSRSIPWYPFQPGLQPAPYRLGIGDCAVIIHSIALIEQEPVRTRVQLGILCFM